MQTETLATPETGLRAGINEVNFFKNMKHLFASSYSVIGELLQNARRAGATKIEITFDPENKKLSITDDGSGINDFSPLIMMCESNWATEVALADKPFGMGLFSAFYAAEGVEFASNGSVLSLTLDDVISRRELHTKPHKGLLNSKTGTTVSLLGLEETLLKLTKLNATGATVSDYELHEKLLKMCKGFGTPVFLNGIEVPRPYALDCGNFEATDIGHVNILNVHRFHEGTDQSISIKYPMLFCQGLPISTPHESTTGPIVHLDTMVFSPKMPDRSHLYNEKESLKAIDASLKQSVSRFLVAKKQMISGESFALDHWQNCIAFDVAHLLNDIPFIPVTCFSEVASIDCEDTFQPKWSEKRRMYSHDEIVSGQMKAWRNVPQSLEYSTWAGTLLGVMYAHDILSLNETVNAGHWIHTVLPDASEFKCVVDVKDMGTESANFHSNYTDYSAQIFLGSGISVAITSKVDPKFKEAFDLKSWVLVPKEDGDTCSNYFAFLCKQCSDSPVGLFGGLNDEWGVRNEDGEADEENRWSQTVSALKGNPLHQILEAAIDTDQLAFSEAHFNQVAFATVAKNPNENSSRKGILKFGTSSKDLFADIAKRIGNNVTAADVEMAIAAALSDTTGVEG